MPASAAERARKSRAAIRSAGLRPVQTRVPDTRWPDLAAECRRQALVVAEADRQDHETCGLIDLALADSDGWE